MSVIQAVQPANIWLASTIKAIIRRASVEDSPTKDPEALDDELLEIATRLILREMLVTGWPAGNA